MSVKCYRHFYYIWVFGASVIWTQGLAYARQVLFHQSTATESRDGHIALAIRSSFRYKHVKFEQESCNCKIKYLFLSLKKKNLFLLLVHTCFLCLPDALLFCLIFCISMTISRIVKNLVFSIIQQWKASLTHFGSKILWFHEMLIQLSCLPRDVICAKCWGKIFNFVFLWTVCPRGLLHWSKQPNTCSWGCREGMWGGNPGCLLKMKV